MYSTSVFTLWRVVLLHAHLVFLTKYRHQILASAHLDRREPIMPDACADFGWDLARVPRDAEHVYCG